MINKPVTTPTTNYQPPTTIFIVGPTASGKSLLAMKIALALNGEIICADSQTIRRGLDIGTVKPSKEDQRQVPHHMLDIVDPYDWFSAAEFKKKAETIIADIQRRERLPIIVGGTGLYIDALFFDFSFDKKADTELRKKLSQMTVDQLQNEIATKGLVMPKNDKNPRHLIRTIESGGMVAMNTTPRQGAVIVGINYPTEQLNLRIEQRVDQMLNDGFVDEVKEILNQWGTPPREWDAIGYKIVLQNLDSNDDINLAFLRNALVVGHRKYAKKQRSWFRRNRYITWFEQPSEVLEYVKSLFE